MKKLTYFHQQVRSRLLRALISVSLVGTCLSGTALAADSAWEVQSGNTLGKIVAEKYPGYDNRQAIMREILKRNPQAFRSENINSLIVGKTLQLPEPADIPELKPPVPKPAEGVDPALQEKVQALTVQVTELEETITILEEENASLQEMVNEAAAGKPTTEPVSAPSPVDDALPQRLAEAEKALSASKATNTTLEEQLAAIQRENEVLQNDLQQIRAAAAVAETKAVGSGNLPWILLGLLTLLTLPLLWLLQRQRAVAPVAAVTSRVITEPTASVEVPPLPVMTDLPPATTSIVLPSDENPDAALKLDIARAYLDLRDSTGAADILQDVLVEGGEQQRQEAREILSFIT
ncbi:MAG: hypothetical protein L3K52_03190 [Candidatus Thiothrix sulfatifontis]|nr:MAG: hypothetical protein L3K52_03190 [Candidatus Thiothrix sulfatifontis]